MSMAKYTPSDPQHNPIRMAEVLAAFSLATDLGVGRSMGYAMRACTLGMQMAGELRIATVEQAELYYSFLLMHSGCTVLSLGLALAIQDGVSVVLKRSACAQQALPPTAR